MKTDNIPSEDLEEQEEQGGGLEPMNSEMARKTIARYVCSQCWGDLSLEPVKGNPELHYVICLRCGKNDTKGYVTRYFVDHRRDDNQHEKIEVVLMLQRNHVLKSEPHTREQILHELGY